MSYKDDYLALEPAIALLEKFSHPRKTPEKYAQLCETLNTWAQHDRNALVAVGLDPLFLDTLPQRIGAFRHACSAWDMTRFSQDQARKQFNAKAPAAYELRDEILSWMRFAYRKDDFLRNKVVQISKGTGHADLLKDLNDCVFLGKEHPAPLAAICFDTTMLDRAQAMTEELSALYSIARGEESKDNSARITRDKAYTFLKHAVDEILVCGRFAFRYNDERRKGYRSLFTS